MRTRHVVALALAVAVFLFAWLQHDSFWSGFESFLLFLSGIAFTRSLAWREVVLAEQRAARAEEAAERDRKAAENIRSRAAGLRNYLVVMTGGHDACRSLAEAAEYATMLFPDVPSSGRSPSGQ